MREIDAILSAYDQAQSQGLECILATVVHVEGSSYRGAGARMLIDEYGQMTGAISGGCLEGDALKKALLALDQQQNKLVTYDTNDENDAVIGAQLGCNGVIQVLFEVIDPYHSLNPIELLRKTTSSPFTFALISLFDLDKTKPQSGTVLLMDENQQLFGEVESSELQTQLIEDASDSIKRQVHFFGEYKGTGETTHAFIDVITPPIHLVLVGAGNDALILYQMAELLGWKITIADGRPSHANSQRFGGSCQVVVANPGGILESISITKNTAFVLMTHNYQYDLAVLKLLLDFEELPYIGILGPKKKYHRMLDDLKLEGIELSESQSKKVFAPVGLQLGAETPAEIGLSILSEIQAVLADSKVQHLREIEGSIHKKDNYEFKSISL